MRPRFHHGSSRYSQRRRARPISPKYIVHGLCLYLILFFGLGLGLGFGLGLGLNPGFGLSLGLGLGTGLSIRLGQSLDMPQMASFDTEHQESTTNVAEEDNTGSEREVMDEKLEDISDTEEVSKDKFDDWVNIPEDAGDDTEKERAEEDEQSNHQTTEN